ncbi:MAG: translation initiation factor IF-2 [Candidatus Latescibacteria bacterium]|nr:translation initiation factor IF-2 [Candidatus Latescibacterota bacterium]
MERVKNNEPESNSGRVRKRTKSKPTVDDSAIKDNAKPSAHDKVHTEKADAPTKKKSSRTGDKSAKKTRVTKAKTKTVKVKTPSAKTRRKTKSEIPAQTPEPAVDTTSLPTAQTEIKPKVEDQIESAQTQKPIPETETPTAQVQPPVSEEPKPAKPEPEKKVSPITPKIQPPPSRGEISELKVFEAAKQLNLSSEAFVSILKELGFTPRGYTAHVTKTEYESIKERLRQEKSAFKESFRKKASPTISTQPTTKQPSIEIQKTIKRTMVKIEHREIKHRHHFEKSTETQIQIEKKKVKVAPYISVAELAHLFNMSPVEIIKKCISLGLLATVNQRLDPDTIMLLADELNLQIEIEEEVASAPISGELEERPPVVVVMGHVDHGKTSLLDYIRKTKVAEKEHGKITQHTGAYVVTYKTKNITFLDTPGHVAFTAMRARGAQITDIAVLVIAADDSIMPQTIEALNHARAAGIPIIVAITKCDLANTNPEMVKSQLAQQGLRVEGYGGDTLCVCTSVRTGIGIEDLLEAILLLSEELKLQSVSSGPAKGVVIETHTERGRGNMITVLVQHGILKRGDSFVTGSFFGRVRDLLNENFTRLDKASPSFPVQVLGSSGLPEAGERFEIVTDERIAREIATRHALMKRDMRLKSSEMAKIGLEQLQQKILDGTVKELKIVLKADTFGSAEALKESLEGLSLDEVFVRVIHFGIGQITTSDVLLAQASQAVIVGYHVTALADAVKSAERQGVEIRFYRIIYAAIDDIRAAMLGLLEPEEKEVVIGKAEVRQVFVIPRTGTIAGSYVTEGKIVRNALARVIRQGKEIIKSKIGSLKRFKEDVKEVESGYECGIGVDNATDIQPQDIIEVYKIEEIARAPSSSESTEK